MKGYIYIIVNDINNKVYIGQTVSPLDVRLKEHFSKSKSKRHSSKFYNAISKYRKNRCNIHYQ